MEQKYADILARQLAYAEKAYGQASRYQYYLDHYTLWNKAAPDVVQKHYTLDATFFISNQGGAGFKVIKFYNNSNDYRVKDGCDTLADAYAIGWSAL